MTKNKLLPIILTLHMLDIPQQHSLSFFIINTLSHLHLSLLTYCIYFFYDPLLCMPLYYCVKIQNLTLNIQLTTTQP